MTGDAPSRPVDDTTKNRLRDAVRAADRAWLDGVVADPGATSADLIAVVVRSVLTYADERAEAERDTLQVQHDAALALADRWDVEADQIDASNAKGFYPDREDAAAYAEGLRTHADDLRWALTGDPT